MRFGRSTHFMALDMSKRIVGGVFIHLGERRVIKTAIDEKFCTLSKEEGCKAGVNQIGRLLANTVNANEDHVLRAKEEF